MANKAELVSEVAAKTDLTKTRISLKEAKA